MPADRSAAAIGTPAHGRRSLPDLRGLALLTLLTLVGVPVLRAGASDAGETVTIQAVATVPAADASTTSLLDDIDGEALFEPGAATTESTPSTVEPPTAALRSTPSATASTPSTAAAASSDGDADSSAAEASTRETAVLAADTGSGSTATAVASTTPATTATTAPPTTAAPTTAAPTTAPPTTAARTTEAAPTTAAPTTEAPTTEAVVASGEPTAEQWAALRQCEAGGRYDAVNPIGYYGAYQFSIGTWDSTARQAGRDDLVGVLPSTAAPADQDAMALALWRLAGPGPWPHCGVHLPPRP